jgi:hypothetical protein
MRKEIPMRRFLTRALVTTVAALALLVPTAYADPPQPKGEGKPVFTYILDFGPITYWDADYIHYGAGTLQLVHVGNDPNNDTVLLKALLKQGGRQYEGSGVLVDKKLVMAIGPYFFQMDVPGWGSYHIIGKPDKLYWVYTETLGGM